ncbi:2-hydroxyglutaryl-CoA dehydratase [Desulfuribacillus stibiiarsenatis]|uniref:2-hydroxyglutaryl-CoA dehydratase n=2 Tax=Desulfuribacillus stibiiarsenatis TaxID=1390249 RepID=A0A1E5L4A7_9FIRM|nr:2-hydroxyglutaryl-CoA dehydratase [Desulfuribacillus stibiiarsenatis]
MYTLGIDVGSVSTKAVLFDGTSYQYLIMTTGFSPKSIGQEARDLLLNKAGISLNQVAKTIGTGYGRIHMPYADKTTNELTCHGKGVHFLYPDAGAVIDIGGQDSKVILLDERGRVRDFLLNDKCAAGTGRFLQVTSQALGIDLDEIDYVTEGQQPVEIGSMCAVFAETEVLNLIVHGHAPGAVLAGVLKSIAVRMTAMAAKLYSGNEIVFTGGLANSFMLRKMFANQSGWTVYVPKQPQIMGALGAAVIGYEMI